MLSALFADTEPERHLPSLRQLGMRGNAVDGNRAHRLGEGEGEGVAEGPQMTRSMIKDAVNRGRRWVEIDF
jgi:hypothetical protein